MRNSILFLVARIIIGSGTFIAQILTLPSTFGSGPTKKFLPPLLTPLQV